MIVNITDDKLIPARRPAPANVDLQARYLRFDNYTFLKQGEKRNHYHVLPVGEGDRLAGRAVSRT